MNSKLAFCMDNASQATHVNLSPEQIDYFSENGYLILAQFFSPEEIKRLSSIADHLQAKAEELSKKQTGKVLHLGTQFVIDKINAKTQIHRIVWAGAAEHELLNLARQPKLLIPVAQLLDSDTADHLINQLHYKLPQDGVDFAWHQDIKNRRTFDPNWKDINGKGSFVQVIIAIDAMKIENGTIFFVPQSHKSGDLFLDKIADEKELARIAHLDLAVPYLLEPGDVLFMHPYLVHGSFANNSTEPRRIFINGFSYPGANTGIYPGEGSSQRIRLREPVK